MELLPDQQQPYQKEQQARARARQVDAERWATESHNELAGEQAILGTEMTELHWRKAGLGTERAATIDYTKAWAWAIAVIVAINQEGMPNPTFPWV
jgi:hypothetical protein